MKGCLVTIGDLAKSKGIWGEKRAEERCANIVLKSSIRFLRNIKGYCFAHKLAQHEKDAIEKKVIKNIESSGYCRNVSIFHLKEYKNSEREILFERNILHGNEKEVSTLVLSHNQDYYFLLNTKDHIEFVILGSGFCFKNIYEQGKKMILELEKGLNFAYSRKYGYLTASPKYSGCGMEMFITLHLAGVVLLSRLNRLIMDLKKHGLRLRSSWIEGYYEIYNKYSVGLVEKKLYEKTMLNFQRTIDNEQEARERVYNENKKLIEDKVWRSYGILLSARMISHFEALDLLSNVRLGVSLGIINLNYITISEINLLLYLIQDFHIRKNHTITAEDQNVDEVRAQFLRDYLQRGNSRCSRG